MNNALGAVRPGAGIVEHTRNDPHNTVANGYPCSAYFNMSDLGGAAGATVTTFTLYAPRIYNTSTGADAVGAAAGVGAYSPLMSTNSICMYSSTYINGLSGAQGASAGAMTLGANSAKQSAHILAPLGISRNFGFTVLGGDISANTGLYATTNNFGSHTDEVSVGADTYAIWAGGTMNSLWTATTRFAIKKA